MVGLATHILLIPDTCAAERIRPLDADGSLTPGKILYTDGIFCYRSTYLLIFLIALSLHIFRISPAFMPW